MFLFIGLAVVLGLTSPVLTESRIARDLYRSKQSQALADAGQDDVGYRIRSAHVYDAQEVLSLNGQFATTTVVENVSTGRKEVTTTANNTRHVRKRKTEFTRGDRVSFSYGAQAGNGGIILQNSSLILGNVYSNGGATGTSNNLIKGTVVSAGATGWVEGLHATSSVWAHTIKDSTVDRDAYYQTKINTTVGGNSYPGSEDKPPAPFPISDEQIDEWEAEAEAGGVHTSPCPYTITSSTSIGPKKINCDLTIKTNGTVTITGALWVVGNISFETGPTIRMDPSFGARGVPIIADNPANRSTASKITIKNSSVFEGSGTPGSVIMLLSRNTSAENGGSVDAIELQQSASGAIMLYTNHGRIRISQSSTLKEVTGWSIILRNSAQITYDQGLASYLFDTGPAGSWNLYTSKETQ